MTSGVVLLEHQQASPGERTALVLMLCDKHTNTSLPYLKATGFKQAIHQTWARLWLKLTACGVTACTWCLSSYARQDPTKTLCRRHDPAWRRRQANFARSEDTSVCLPPAPAMRQTWPVRPRPRPDPLGSNQRHGLLSACLPLSTFRPKRGRPSSVLPGASQTELASKDDGRRPMQPCPAGIHSRAARPSWPRRGSPISRRLPETAAQSGRRHLGMGCILLAVPGGA